MFPSRSGILAEVINTKILANNHPDSPHSHLDSPRSHHSPHSVPLFSVPAFTDNLKRSVCQGHCAYFTTLIATIHIIASGLWLIREKLNDVFI